MVRLNKGSLTQTPFRETLQTHEGAPARRITPEQELRRSVLSCMLWEDTFYESGQEISDRIRGLVPKVSPESVAALTVEARTRFKLRHVPLLLIREMARQDEYKSFVSQSLAQTISRPDELTEFLAIYWGDGRQPLSAQVKKGLAQAFRKFDAYQLTKYNRDTPIKLRDVLFLCHAKPKDEEQAQTWKMLVDGKLPSPDTWEVSLSAGADKRETFQRLIRQNKLGGLAMLRNLRNMLRANVDPDTIRYGLTNMNASRVFPFRFITAAKFAPQFEPELEQKLFESLNEGPVFTGQTALLIDVSYSMQDPLSRKSQTLKLDAACGLALLCRELCESIRIFVFSNEFAEVPPRRGFALRDAVWKTIPFGGTYLGGAVDAIKKNVPHDRLIVVTDEQAHDQVANPLNKGYMLNVGTYQNGVGYGPWVHVDGWSEAVLDFIFEYERL